MRLFRLFEWKIRRRPIRQRHLLTVNDTFLECAKATLRMASGERKTPDSSEKADVFESHDDDIEIARFP